MNLRTTMNLRNKLPQPLLDAFVREKIHSYVQLALNSAREEGLLDAAEEHRPDESQTHPDPKLVKIGYALSLYAAAVHVDQRDPFYPPPSHVGVTVLSLVTYPLPIFYALQSWIPQIGTICKLTADRQYYLRRSICGCVSSVSTRDSQLDKIAAHLHVIASSLLACYGLSNAVSPQSISIYSVQPVGVVQHRMVESELQRSEQHDISTHHAAIVPNEDPNVQPAPGPYRSAEESPAKRSRSSPSTRKRGSISAVRKRRKSNLKNQSSELCVVSVENDLVHQPPSPAPLLTRALTSQVHGFPAAPAVTAQINSPPLPANRKPAIWAASRDELCQIMPELRVPSHEIVVGRMDTPVLFLDSHIPGNAVKWAGGKTIQLIVTKPYYHAHPSVQSQFDGKTPIKEGQLSLLASQMLADQPLRDARVDYDANEGLYMFAPEFDNSPDAGANSFIEPGANVLVPRANSLDITTFLPENAPEEILALELARKTHTPVNIILCRGADIAALALPHGCGCAFLGFFFVADVRVTQSGKWADYQEGPIMQGQISWQFTFEWTPGGEDPDAIVASSQTPWWMESQCSSSTFPSDEQTNGITLEHPYTLLPLHLLVPPPPAAEDIRGWHCTTCGRLNQQRNLRIQSCASCLTSNGFPPAIVEHVRPERGTDPNVIPSDKWEESVVPSETNAPDGLRRFTYVITEGVTVHHLFTRNRMELQAEASELFRDLQVDMELVAERGASRARGAGATFSAQFGRASAVKGKGKRTGVQWPSDVPQCVSQARELMLRRTRMSGEPVLEINVLTISAWRKHGNNKGCMLDAKHSPVIVLCLGADVELSFRRGSIPNHAANAVGEDIPHLSAEDSIAAKPANKKVKGQTKEVLMVTLVHGDLLVAEGDIFDYSLHKMGFSIVLFGF